jgi:hypothetical protein
MSGALQPSLKSDNSAVSSSDRATNLAVRVRPRPLRLIAVLTRPDTALFRPFLSLTMPLG